MILTLIHENVIVEPIWFQKPEETIVDFIALYNIKIHKSTGHDNMPHNMVKLCVYIVSLTKLANQIQLLKIKKSERYEI